MKNTICEKLIWSAMTPAIFKYIAAHCKNTDTSSQQQDYDRHCESRNNPWVHL